ncbi:MAG: zinc-dependent metalloprotease [Flavobacteriales bacterium]|nr:zinc-dependent metalloprotease [Flavobacteriales bacterium]
MKILKLYALAFFVCLNSLGYSQDEKCATVSSLKHSGQPASEIAEIERIKQIIDQQYYSRDQDNILIIPTVVHMFYYTIESIELELGNISDEQVIDGLRVLNEDFSRQNADTTDTNPLFKEYAASIGFEFRLAQIDPNGQPTNGIVRIDTSMIPDPEPTEPNFNNVKYLSQWPADKYFNIWIVRSIAGGSLGYAQYPGTDFTYGGPWETWGPVVINSQWGTIGTSSADGRTATHEVGHCFGLYHTFLSQTASCGAECDTTGDEVCDTPPSLLDFNCAIINSCSNDSLGSSPYPNDVIDQMENFMSYNSCQNMFTNGQKSRMLGFYNAFDTIVGLSTYSNLIATGVIPITTTEETIKSGISLKLYPNPTSEHLTIEILTPFTLGEIYLYDIMGKAVLSKPVTNKKSELKLDHLASGIYYLSISLDNESATSKKIIIR